MQEIVLQPMKSKKNGAHVGLARSRLALQHPNEGWVGVFPPPLCLGMSGLPPSVPMLPEEKAGKARAKPSGTFVTGTGTAPSIARREMMSHLWKEELRGTAFRDNCHWHKY